MLPTDAELAGLCAAIYGETAASAFDHFDNGVDDGVCWAIKRLPGYDVIVLRGSLTLQDWLTDLNALPVKTRIGHVHNGFHIGMEHAWADIRPLLKQPAIITGHSLGAARAIILTAFMVKDGQPPIARVTFGSPKPGFADLADIIKDVPAVDYRNGNGIDHDYVTDVPAFPTAFIHPKPLTDCCGPAATNDPDIAFRWHHIGLYQIAVTPPAVPVSV